MTFHLGYQRNTLIYCVQLSKFSEQRYKSIEDCANREEDVQKRNYTIFTSLSLLPFLGLAEGIGNATRPEDPYGAL